MNILLNRRGGRPCLPPAPTNAADTRALIAREITKTNPSLRRLQQLYRLLTSFVAAEDAVRADLKNQLLIEQNRLAAETNALRKSDYRLRFSKSEHGLRSLLTESERLKQRNRTLEMELGKTVVHFALPCGLDCGVMQEQDKSSESGVYVA